MNKKKAGRNKEPENFEWTYRGKNAFANEYSTEAFLSNCQKSNFWLPIKIDKKDRFHGKDPSLYTSSWRYATRGNDSDVSYRVWQNSVTLNITRYAFTSRMPSFDLQTGVTVIVKFNQAFNAEVQVSNSMVANGYKTQRDGKGNIISFVPDYDFGLGNSDRLEYTIGFTNWPKLTGEAAGIPEDLRVTEISFVLGQFFDVRAALVPYGSYQFPNIYNWWSFVWWNGKFNNHPYYEEAWFDFDEGLKTSGQKNIQIARLLRELRPETATTSYSTEAYSVESSTQSENASRPATTRAFVESSTQFETASRPATTGDFFESSTQFENASRPTSTNSTTSELSDTDFASDMS